VKGYGDSKSWKEWIAEKDFKTCVVCRTLDGKTFGINEPVREPPLHPNCRCKIVTMQMIGGKDADYYIDAIVASGKSVYNNIDGKLPETLWRIWYEADTANIDGNKGQERILYSSDGLVFVTRDHYRTFLEVKGSYNNINDLPSNVQNAYNKYDDNGWIGNVSGQTPGTGAGGVWDNDYAQLPTTDSTGSSITYKEFDVNNKISGSGRDGERFVVGSDGSIYYTSDHYETFTKIN